MDGIFASLKGRRVLITGSSRGIGKALAIGFAKNGAAVALHGVTHTKAMEEAIAEVSRHTDRVTAVFGDLSDPNVPEQLVKETVEKLGGIDILICNASIQIRRPWFEISQEEMLLQTQTNFFSNIKLMQLCVPKMMERKSGRIITIGSTQQDKPHPEMVVYAGTKSAMLNVVQNLALQLAAENITVNNIAVGTIYTDRNAAVLEDPVYHQKVKEDIPMKKIGMPEDCVGAVLMLSSEAGRYITGENLHIDGGKYI